MNESASKTCRAFLAVRPPPEIVAELVALQKDLGRHLSAIRWVPSANLHLTLRFLGDITPAQVEAVSRVTQTVAATRPLLPVAVRGLGVFPQVKKPRILWAGLSGETGPLFAARRELDRELEPLGFAPEKRAFKAHLTLGRFKGPVFPPTLVRALDNFSAFCSKSFYVKTLILYKSDLGPGGPEYTQLAAWPLQGPAPAPNNLEPNR